MYLHFMVSGYLKRHPIPVACFTSQTLQRWLGLLQNVIHAGMMSRLLESQASPLQTFLALESAQYLQMNTWLYIKGDQTLFHFKNRKKCHNFSDWFNI